MRMPVIAVSPDTPVEVAATLMAENKIGALPVIDSRTDGLVGIVSQTDLFTTLARLLGSRAPGTRLELHLEDLPRQLTVIGLTAERHHVTVNSLIAFRAEDGGSVGYEVIVRVGTIDPRVFVDELRRDGIVVSSADER
jgi:acetoin utilization protein AcuB